TPVPVSTNYEYEATIEIPDYTGNISDYSFWVGENGVWSSTYSANASLSTIVSECKTGLLHVKMYALQESGQPHGSDYKNFGVHGSCSVNANALQLKSDVREFDLATPPTEITLTATADETTTGNYVWYKSDDDGATYTKVAESASNTYTLSGANIPVNPKNYYKVTRKLANSAEHVEAICVIYTVQSCGKDSKGTVIFSQDFGTLTAIRGTGSRSEFTGIVDGYEYQPAPYKINDGYYAVVANPYYCGCGNGSNMSQEVTDGCLQEGVWFRNLPDHTLFNDTQTGPYGGMLMINFNGTGIAYQRVLTEIEKKDITKNSILKFSAYFASAAVQSKQDVTFNPINVELIIQFKKTGSSTWEDAATIQSQVTYSEGWQRSEVEWKVEDNDGDFRVVINNHGATGDGNDLLIDDVSLNLCTPAFALYFYDQAKDLQFEEKVAQKLDEESTIRIKQINFGSLGNDPCVQLYKRIVNGTSESYVYVSDLTLSNGYYTTSVSPREVLSDVPGEAELVAVASVKAGNACDTSIAMGVENGTYKPGMQNNVVFSGNSITYSIECGTSQLTSYEDVAKICESDPDHGIYAKMPKLKLSSNNISNVVYFDIYVNNQPFMQEVQYREQTAGCGYMLLDLDAIYYDANAEYYQWPVGTNTIKVKVSERFIDASVCERWANGSVAVQVVARPSINTEPVGDEICEGSTATLSIDASPVTKYQWQVMVPGDADWSNVGTNSATFTTPSNIANETQYRVQLYNDNDLLCATTSEVAIVTTKSCNDMQLTQSADVQKVCVGDEFIYSVSLFNNAAGNANNVFAVVEWDPAVLQLDEETVCVEFNTVTHVWRAGYVFPSKASAGLGLKFKVISNDVPSISIKSYVSSLNNDTFDSYEDQTSAQMKGETIITFNDAADTPSKKRPNEIFAYNLCRTGDPTEKISYDFLIEGAGTGSSLNLIWMDMDYKVIPSAEAYFYADKPKTDSLYVYNAPEGFCPSDTIKVRYRVKDYSPNPTVKDYVDCVIEGASEELLKTLVVNDNNCKYLVFKTEDGEEVTTFDPSVPGKNTYYVTAYREEIYTCGSDSLPIIVNVKDYAIDANIAADGAEICPGADVTLSAATQFDEKQDNVVIRWYSDPNLGAESLLATDDDYDMEKVLTDTYVYVTVETNNYCENQAGDAKEVYVAMKQASPELEIQPKEQLITIGGVPSFVVTPNYVGQAAEYSVWVNGEQVESLADYKPYIDSEYTIVFDGECGVTADTASVTVQWPTVFTPYVHDGLNDTFVKDMDPNFHTEIFNRFGMPLMTTDNGWDGYLSDGKLAVPGVYYYVVNLPDGNVKKGTIEVFKK
ncbi:MAG: gliding motility-associated C-terminal domain-containing protein, partial [Paludibacteraceae bacterium]|nr:gliding motility-associated C-terminal domain-containing protein [Paludibacteraceae bacterium]